MLTLEPTPVANGWDDKGKRIVETWWSAKYGGDPTTEVVTNCPLKSALLALHYARTDTEVAS